MKSFIDMGYVPGLLGGQIKIRHAFKDEDGVWWFGREGAPLRKIPAEQVFGTQAAAESQAGLWWPEAVVPKR